MGSPSAMGELLPFRQDGDNDGPWPVCHSGAVLETHRRGIKGSLGPLTAGGLSVDVDGDADATLTVLWI
jgi:hypothetical protein